MTLSAPRQGRDLDIDIDLRVPEPAACTPYQDAIEEIDRAAALLLPELDARDTVLHVRVVHQEAGPCPHESGSALGLSINGSAVSGGATRDCRGEGESTCAVFVWDGATHVVPPAEMVVALVQQHLDLGSGG